MAAHSTQGLAAELIDNFDSGRLDTRVWDTRQADYPRLIKFGTEQGSTARYLANLIDERRQAKEDPPAAPCAGQTASAAMAQDVDLPERLGPSLIFPDAAPLRDGAKCSVPEFQDGLALHQRNELRFQSKDDRHPIEQPHWYQVIMKADGDIPQCGSTRWVTAQWKYDDRCWPAGRDMSPFLAQRFDNGVLHVTVQYGECRCMIAKAEGDPDRIAAVSSSTPARSDISGLRPIKPLKCILSGETKGGCEPDPSFVVLSTTSPRPPSLPSPKDGWVNMMYRVKAGSDGEIDVYANGRFIVRVKGLIGYPWGTPGLVKFKFGHYRDKIPGRARLLYDRICLSENAATCDPGLQVLN